jgi:hypothetical protein
MYDISLGDFIDTSNGLNGHEAIAELDAQNSIASANPSVDPDDSVTSKKPKQRVKRYCPKWEDMNQQLECEWDSCSRVLTSMDEYLSHLNEHLEEHINANRESNCFRCEWDNCDSTEFFCESTFTRHVKFHAFHSKLKQIGTQVLKTLQENSAESNKTAPKCNLDDETRNYIPELPYKFECSWNMCDYTTDNPEHFYRHIKSMHVDPYPTKCKDSKCLWSNCEQMLADKNRLVEHIRHHSQEKLVACPNCGALFAVISKFIDHCSRSSELGSKID